MTAINPPAVAPIEISVTNVRNDRGRVHVDICTRETFLADCRYSGEAPAHAGTTLVVIRGVPPGRYAAQGTQDENGNGEVDRGLLGIPKEGVGFSNDARIRLSPPKFEDAAFDHGSAPQRISFSLRYFLR